MIRINYDSQTRGTTLEEVADVEMPVENVVAKPTDPERITSLENAMLDLILGGI